MAKGSKLKGAKSPTQKRSSSKSRTVPRTGDTVLSNMGLPFDRVVVLAIGVETYQKAPKRNVIGDAAYAQADATAFLETMKAIYEPAGIEVDGHLLCDAQASLTTLREMVSYLIQGLAPTDLFVFFYAGHGYYGDGDNRLTAYDTNPDNLADTTLNLGEEVLRPLQTSQGRRALLFVDACAVELSRAAKGRSVLHSLDPRELEAFLDEQDYVGIFLSCSPGEKSYGASTLNHGAYTAHVLQALRGEVPDALEADRWLTDTGLRDWLAVAVRRFVTHNMQVSGQQTPRAILNAPHSFRIRYIQAPKAPPAVTLADLKLTNRDAYLEGVETGAIRSLQGFSTAKGHTVPKTISQSASDWVERLLHEELTAELDALRARTRSAFGLARKDTNVEWGDGGGTLDSPIFRFTILCDQDQENPSNWRVRRQLELRDGWEAHADVIDTLFATTDLPVLVVEIDRVPRAFDDLADALDGVATAKGGHLGEETAKRRLTYTQGVMTLTIDLVEGRVELSFDDCGGLEVVGRARTLGLGWCESSPMLPPPGI